MKSLVNKFKNDLKSPFKSFLLISFISFVLFLLFLLIFGLVWHKVYNFGIAKDNPISWFGDFFEINFIAGNNDLDSNSNPALVLFLGKIFYYVSGGPINSLPLIILASSIFILIPVVTIIVVSNAFLKKKFNKNDRIKIMLCLFFSMPFMFLFQRGNYLIYAFLFTIIFLFWYDSDNKIKKELSYVFLSLAIGIKFYPAIFAILLFKKRDWMGILKLLLYSAFFLIVPFFIFPNGVDVFIKTIKNIIGYVSGQGSNGSYDVSLKSFVAFLTWIFTRKDYPSIYSLNNFNLITNVLSILLLAICIFIALNVRKKWQFYLLCSLTISLVASPAFFYTLVFLYIPFVSWIQSDDDQYSTVGNKLLFFSILFVFQPLYLGTITMGNANLSVVVKQVIITPLFLIMLFILLKIAVTNCKEFILSYNKKRYEK